MGNIFCNEEYDASIVRAIQIEQDNKLRYKMYLHKYIEFLTWKSVWQDVTDAVYKNKRITLQSERTYSSLEKSITNMFVNELVPRTQRCYNSLELDRDQIIRTKIFVYRFKQLVTEQNVEQIRQKFRKKAREMIDHVARQNYDRNESSVEMNKRS